MVMHPFKISARLSVLVGLVSPLLVGIGAQGQLGTSQPHAAR